MADIHPTASYLLTHFLGNVLIDGKAPRLPSPAPGANIEQNSVFTVVQKLTTRIDVTTKEIAGVSLQRGEVHFSHGWLCDRWCSTYLLLKSLLLVPVPETPIVPVIEPYSAFVWPLDVPEPRTTSDPFVNHSNNVFPWVIVPTILHEIAHALVQTSGKTKHEIEFACDEFAVRYFLGNRKDHLGDIVTLGVTIWQCCLCSWALGAGPWQGVNHPNPAERLRRVLQTFVPSTTEIGLRAWMIATAHIARLARFYDMPQTDGVLAANHPTLDALLEDLCGCWEP